MAQSFTRSPSSVSIYKDNVLVVNNISAIDFKDANAEIGGNASTVNWYHNLPGIADGRLTLTTGVPITSSDVTAAGTIYYTPYIGDKISLYDGTRWKVYTFSELSLALTLTSGSVYDVFIYDNSGTLTLETLVWTNITTRATAVDLTNGVYLKHGALTRRLLGTIRASGTNTTEDSALNRYVNNVQNQVPRALFTCPGYNNNNTITTYTTTSTSWTGANGGTGSTINYIVSISSFVDAAIFGAGSISDGSNGCYFGIGEDSTSQVNVFNFFVGGGSGQLVSSSCRRQFGQNTVGAHTLNFLITVSGGTGTFRADNARPGGNTADPFLTYLQGTILG